MFRQTHMLDKGNSKDICFQLSMKYVLPSYIHCCHVVVRTCGETGGKQCLVAAGGVDYSGCRSSAGLPCLCDASSQDEFVE